MEEVNKENNDVAEDVMLDEKGANVPDNNPFANNDENNTMNNSSNSDVAEDEADLEKSTGPEIAAPMESADNEENALFIGDTVQITTRKHGIIRGMIYYIDDSVIRVMPEGSSDRLTDVPLPDDNTDPDDIDIIDLAYNNGPRSSFVELLALRSGLTIQTYKSDGTYLKDYTVEEVNPHADSARLRDETGAVQTVDFNYTGIPRDIGFDVIMVKSYEPEGAVEAAIANNLDSSTVNNVADVSAEVDEEDEDIVLNVSEFAEMEVPEIQTFSRARSSEIIYPEIVQKNDFLNNLISIIEPDQQTNQHVIRKLRSMVEMTSIMKNQLIKRSFDGTIVGDASISAHTLDDVLRKRAVPLAVPVIDADRYITVKVDKKVDAEGVIAPIEGNSITDEILPGISVHDGNDTIFPKIKEGLEKIYDETPADSVYPKFYQYLNNIVEKYPPGYVFNTIEGKTYDFTVDKEFYRTIPGTAVFGLDHAGKEPTAKSIRDTISYSVGRGLAATQRNGSTIEIVPTTRATHVGTVLYPLQAVSTFGSTRTGKLFVDIARSHGLKTLSSQVLTSLDGVEVVGADDKSIDIQKALYFDADSTRTSQMSFNDFLEITLKAVSPRGPGDLTAYQADYGIADYEYTQEQMEIIGERVRSVIGAIRARINELRSVKPAQSSIVSQVLPESDYVEKLKASAATHTAISDAIKELASIMPNYQDSDLALTAYMIGQLQDYFYAVLSGQSTAISRETVRFHRDNLIKVRDTVFRIRRLAAEKRAPPSENPCQHVKELAAIEAVSDDAQRMALMVKFKNTYVGKRDPENENWYNCTLCKKHALCNHTHLQIQQFLHPREKESIQKELILTYAGRVYNGSYICGNCGVSLRRLDFDQSLEFDDEGRPLVGRTVIDVKGDADEDDALKQRLGITDEDDERELDVQNPEKKKIYDIVKQINGKLGIVFNKESHKRVINNSMSYFKNLKSKAVYEADIKKEGKKASAAALPYEVYENRSKVLIIIAQIIIEIQSVIPNYMPLYTEPGCRAGFDGYPLLELENPVRENVGTMIHYMACCVHPLVFKDTAPWPQTGWRSIAKQQERADQILDSIIRVVRGIAATDYVKRKLTAKRTYLERVYGRKVFGERPSEVIPGHYLPSMMYADEEQQVAAEQPVSSGVVTKNNRSQHTYNVTAASLQAQGWINTGHAAARKTVSPAQTVRAETASCFGPITVPQEYMKTHADTFPDLPPRIVPTEPYKARTIIGVPQFIPPAPLEDTHLDTKYSWQVFLTLCYQGERIGEPHEYGVGHVCDWCGLKAPSEYLYPDVDKHGAPLVDEAAVKTFIQTQGVDMSDESFYKLVNASHRKMIYTPYSVPPTERDSVLNMLPAVQPEPVADMTTETEDETVVTSWKEHMDRIIDVVKDGEVKTDAGFLTRIQDFSSAMDGVKAELRRLYTVHQPRAFEGFTIGLLFDTFDKILADKRAFNLIRTYYLVPIQRIINGFVGSTYIRAHIKDSTTIFKDGDDPSQAAYNAVLQGKIQWQNRVRVGEIGADGLQAYTYKLSAYLKNATEMTARRIPYASVLMPELMKGFFYGPLLGLVEGAASDAERIEILRMINGLTRVYATEMRAYDINLIREIKQKMVENEKQTMISAIDKLTPEQRKIEMQLKNKRIKSHLTGINYALAASSAVYKYDPTADFWQNMSSIDAAYEADGIAYVREDVYADTDAGYDVAVDHGDD